MVIGFVVDANIHLLLRLLDCLVLGWRWGRQIIYRRR